MAYGHTLAILSGAMNETQKRLKLLPILMQDHCDVDGVAPTSPTSWDLSPC